MKKRKYEKKTFESTGDSSDTSANIYVSMLMSPAWMNLSANQQRLYVYCKAQYYAQKRKPLENPLAFTMNREKWGKEYKLYSLNSQDCFYRDRDALIAHGFIRVLEGGQNIRKKTIYALWDMWRFWGTSFFKIGPEDMSSSMLHKSAGKE